jgi:protocatechuate 3,4-dioxygenase beta subunit
MNKATIVEHEDPNLDRGLSFDLSTVMNRRRALQVFAGAGLVALAGCKASGGSSTTTSTAAPGASSSNSTTEIPDETAGPYPADGSNGPNVLDDSGIVRSDIRSSFGEYTGTAQGVPLQIELTLLNMDNGFAPYAGAAVYLWHCDREGRYSLYSNGITNQNYLRGVQVADSAGKVRYTSIFPAAYSGRWPHIHFEVYSTVDDATNSKDPIATSQLALPQDVSNAVYATEGYSASIRNMAQTSLAGDNVFGDDDGIHQLAVVSGSVSSGYVAALNVPIAASTASVQTNAGEGGAPTGSPGGPGGPPPR